MVNIGYQRDDERILDYELWDVGTYKLRGPAPNLAAEYFTCIGAAQTFGRFVERPYPTLVAKGSGFQVLNLGFSGAGPSFFLRNPDLLSLINRGKFTVVQFFSGRSLCNSIVTTEPNQGVLKWRTGEEGSLFAEDMYKKILATLMPPELSALRAEIREVYCCQMTELLRSIEVPKVLLYWSEREPQYRHGLADLQSYWGGFPHFVNQEVIDRIKPFADEYVQVVGRPGLPQPLKDKKTGEPVIMWPEDKFPSVKLRDCNHYYPSPEMHAQVADALKPALKSIIHRPSRSAAIRKPRSILVHVHIFKNAGSSVDASLSECFGSAWMPFDPPASNLAYTQRELSAFLDERTTCRAVSSHQIRFPFDRTERYNFHPILFLRHPILRVQSIYEYERLPSRSKTSADIHTRKANELDFASFISWCLSETAASGPISNYQTRVCAQTFNGSMISDWQRPVGLSAYLEAVDNLTNNCTVGIVEDFSTSSLRMERELRSIFPHFSFRNTVKNSTAAPGQRTARTLEGIQLALGRQVYNQLCLANAYDLMLYERFSGRLFDRIVTSDIVK